MIIADTGFWLALANRRDRHHLVATERLSQIHEPLITTWPVVTETCYLLLKHLGKDAQVSFMQSYTTGAYDLFDMTNSHVPRILELLEKYVDLPMDLADASLMILAEHLEEGRILSTDNRDFSTYRWKNHRPFKNLLLNI